MSHIANTPKPPYYAVIFTSVKNDETPGYNEMGEKMYHLAIDQPGFLGVESVGEGQSITVSYWTDLESIKNWKSNSEHQIAQETGRKEWYKAYKTRIALVERDYAFGSED